MLSIPPLPEGQVNLATVFSLANDNALATFDVKQLPQALVVSIILATLTAIADDQLHASIIVSASPTLHDDKFDHSRQRKIDILLSNSVMKAL